MLASDIPIRYNSRGGGQSRVDASWWNIIRTFLIDAFPGTVGENAFNLLNNQNTPADIPNLIIDKDEYVFFKARLSYTRRTALPLEIRTYTEIVCTYRTDTGWDLEFEHNRDFPEVVFSINPTTGQVSYTSDNMSGSSYFGKGYWRILDIAAKEI